MLETQAESAASQESITRQIEPDTDMSSQLRWGTAQPGAERKLLLHVRGHSQPVIVSLSDRLVIGRFNLETGEAPEVDLVNYGAEEAGVSRRHAAIVLEDNAVKIIDLGSANHTFINGQRLIAHQTRILRDGDELRFGKLVVRISFA